MLHAVLHGKLDEVRPEPERLEDALTSTVFGMLAWADAWDLTARWLGVASPVAEPANTNCWFWPRLKLAEPDVVIRLGSHLLVVEAKLRSGRNDLPESEGPQDERPRDQLKRQYESIRISTQHRARYPETLELAIRECSLVQALVVDARRRSRAQREVAESRALLPQDARLELVTWQTLYRLLEPRAAPTSGRWARDLRRYLERLGLASFEGFPGKAAGPAILSPLLLWRPRQEGGIRRALARGAGDATLAALRRWRVRAPEGAARSPLNDLLVRALDAQPIVRAWRAAVRGALD